jgi:heme/copper-type cytochrome/quinol oxidase subunit 3
MTLHVTGNGQQPEAQLKELEEPRVTVRIVWVAARVFTASVAFFFVGFLFAYVYLKSVDAADKWIPNPARPSILFGGIILAAVVASAVLVRVATRAITGAWHGEVWQLLGGAALVLGLLAVVLQVWELAAHHLGFPVTGGYPSVFVGWCAFLALFQLGAMYWLGTLVSQIERARGTGGMNDDERESFRAHSSGFAFFWTFIAVVQAIAFVLLYLVR